MIRPSQTATGAVIAAPKGVLIAEDLPWLFSDAV